MIEADDGEAGFAMFEERAPAIVITDLVMPKKEGIETIRQMRLARPSTKIIAMSGSSELDPHLYLDAAKKLGADATMSPRCDS